MGKAKVRHNRTSKKGKTFPAGRGGVKPLDYRGVLHQKNTNKQWFKKKILKIEDWLYEHPSLEYGDFCMLMDEKEGNTGTVTFETAGGEIKIPRANIKGIVKEHLAKQKRFGVLD